MATYRIRPCARLSGEITVHSAKNAVLPLMCGALLTRETVTIEQIPALTDVKTLTDILRDCGVLMHADQAEKLLTMTADSPRSPRREDLLSRMRASVLVMGPLLAAGITSSISVQAFLNMGVVVGILPTTGLPLPFFSAGGTSISITMAAIGILLNISRESAI